MRKDDANLLERIHESFRRIGLDQPHLAGLIRSIRLQLDERVDTMGVFASGRLLINPDFARKLSTNDLTFVLTHELYHLTLRTHERGEGTDPFAFNIAHDYIINDMLREEFQLARVPAGGLDWPGARHLSAEKILGEMARDTHNRPEELWQPDQPDQAGRGTARRPQPNKPTDGRDVLDARQEQQMFPDAAADQQARTREVEQQAARAMSLQALMKSMQGRGAEPGKNEDSVTALRGLYRPPWELALQRWLDSVAPSERSYARPSRRGADRTDVVLPGRKREGWTLHIVLDTSGSMVNDLPHALGTIAAFCESVGVEEVHLIQCDTDVGSDQVVAPAELAQWQIVGFGGSDLTPALRRLAENPEVGAALVLTDGDIEYPPEPMPYNVLWVLPAWKNPQEFSPPYGKVISMTHA